MKNYIGFVNDHSGSMAGLAQAAIRDFNTNIKSVKEAASREMLDTVVSVSEVGYGCGLSVMVSNPHVLQEKKEWRADGGTPLWTGTLNLINMLKAMPDADKADVSFLIMLTTDGEATDHHTHAALKLAMQPLLATGRWTFVARVPGKTRGTIKANLHALGIHPGNIQDWDTTEAGMAASTQATTKAMDGYFALRASGAKSSSSFYSDASNVNVAALEDISKKVSLYVVPAADEGIQIRDFILRYRMEYLKGAAFYQLTKTEARVSHTKMVLVRDQATGKIFAGKEARSMIGLPNDRNARLHPGDHAKFDLFIQSESINRKLVGGTGVVYWKELGTAFTQEELDRFNGPATPAAAAPAVVALPKVPVSNTPTKSPIPVAKRVCHFETREEARRHCAAVGKPQSAIRKNSNAAFKNQRWAV
jgi:hypothetical protein